MALEVFSVENLERFDSILKVDLEEFFTNYVNFMDSEKPKIEKYYLGEIEYPQDSFKTFNKLRGELNEIFSKLNQEKERFDKYDDWIVFENLEEIRHTFNIINSLDRFLRSSIVNERYSSSPKLNIVLSQNQSLEQLSRESGSDDESNDWLDIAIDNKLREEDYSFRGNISLKLEFKNSKAVFINTVLDVMTPETIYGKDIDRDFIVENNDLKDKSGFENLIQVANILSILRKNGNPLFPEDGIDKRLVVGRNFNSIALPSIFRQLYQIHQRDGRFRSIEIKEVLQEGQKTIIKYELVAIGDEILPLQEIVF